MRVLFLLPDIQAVPTGGNIYNQRIIEALGVYAVVSTRVWRAGDLLDDVPAAVDCVVVDSLISEAIKHVIPSAGNQKWVLLVHYLPACDPSKGVLADDDLLDLLHRYSGFITTSQFSKKCLIQLGISGALVEVIYPGLDDVYRNVLRNDQHKEADCRILTVSSLLPGKGLIEFVDVLEQLPAGSWQWDVVGDDALDAGYAAAFKEKIKQSRVSSQLRWLGAMPPEEMPALYTSYNLFVLPSRFETLGMAIREAMACGVPVIAYDTGGINESLAQGGGCLIIPYDQRLMLAVVRAWMGDGEKRQKVGDEAQELSTGFPSWQDSAGLLRKMIARF